MTRDEYQRAYRKKHREKMIKYLRAYRRKQAAKVCACGCGGKPKSAQFLPGHNARLITKAQRATWKKREYPPLKPRIDEAGYVKLGHKHVHRILMEAALGRKLRRNEVVHHINGDRADNSYENLQVMTISEHVKLHRTGKPSNRWKKKKADST